MKVLVSYMKALGLKYGSLILLGQIVFVSFQVSTNMTLARIGSVTATHDWSKINAIFILYACLGLGQGMYIWTNYAH